MSRVRLLWSRVSIYTPRRHTHRGYERVRMRGFTIRHARTSACRPREARTFPAVNLRTFLS